jgi:hypothetical protein
MSEILLVNPKKRRKSRRKMSALQAKYFGGGRKRRHKRRTASSTNRRRRTSVVVHSNPRRRRRSLITRSVRRMRRRHSNPSFRPSLGGAVPMLKAGAVGAVGALGLDFLWGYGKSYLPASIAGSALAQYAVKLAGALAVGIIGGKVLKGKGKDLAVGATTVVLHDAFKAQLLSAMPSLPLGEYLSYAPVQGSMRRAGRVLSTGMGEYLSGLPNSNPDGSYSGEYTEDNINGY